MLKQVNNNIMKRIILLNFIVIAGQTIFGQAAGNYVYSQKGTTNERTAKTDNAYYNNNYTYQAAYPVVVNEKDSVINLTVNVLMNVDPNAYVAILGTSQVSETVESSHQMINDRIDSFINAIKLFGIKNTDTYIDFISQFPIFEIEIEKKLFSKSYNEIPKGFEIKKNVHVRFSDINILEKLLIEAAKKEMYDIIKVDYIINDYEAIYDSLRVTAIRVIDEKLKDFKRLGIKYDAMYSKVEESVQSTYPFERYSNYTPFNSSSNTKTSSGKNINSGSTKSQYLFYDKLPYSAYDVIINPDVVKPHVQFSYKMTVKYVLKKNQ